MFSYLFSFLNLNLNVNCKNNVSACKTIRPRNELHLKFFTFTYYNRHIHYIVKEQPIQLDICIYSLKVNI